MAVSLEPAAALLLGAAAHDKPVHHPGPVHTEVSGYGAGYGAKRHTGIHTFATRAILALLRFFLYFLFTSLLKSLYGT